MASQNLMTVELIECPKCKCGVVHFFDRCPQCGEKKALTKSQESEKIKTDEKSNTQLHSDSDASGG